MSCGLKICGVTRAQDVDACVELGVDAIGFNLWAESPRALTREAARVLLGRVPRPGPLRVAVVVDYEPHELDGLDFDAVQLHGTRTFADYPGLALDHIAVVRGTPPLATLPRSSARWILLDAAVPGFGGRGVVHDWGWAASARAALAPVPVWLAGGLDPDNAAAAIAAVRPAGIDVASGAEDGVPGHKSRTRIAALRAICDRVPS
jgi:phosphoribosylanthranilate isomerase